MEELWYNLPLKVEFNENTDRERSVWISRSIIIWTLSRLSIETLEKYENFSLSIYCILFRCAEYARFEVQLRAPCLNVTCILAELAYLRNVAPRDALSDHMNGPVRAKLMATEPNLAMWGVQSGQVFNTLWTDFMKPAEDIGKFNPLIYWLKLTKHHNNFVL